MQCLAANSDNAVCTMAMQNTGCSQNSLGRLISQVTLIEIPRNEVEYGKKPPMQHIPYFKLSDPLLSSSSFSEVIIIMALWFRGLI